MTTRSCAPRRVATRRAQELSKRIEGLAKYKTIYLAYSGGLDSTVLLHRLANSEAKSKIKVIHINHDLSPNAKQWEQHCQTQCDSLKLPLQIIKVKAKADQGESPEAAARNARYAAFKSLMQEGGVLLTAHHQDDQIETFFLQLFRGAGIKGLAAMPVEKTFCKGSLVRPLLEYSRADLERHAKEHRLQWVEDESNFDTNFQRNFLRQTIIPKLKQTWPGMNQSVLRSVEHCQEANELLDDLAAIDLDCVQISEAHSKKYQLNITKLLNLSSSRRFNLLRYWIQQQGHKLPSQKKLIEIDKSVLQAKEDANPIVTWEGTEIRRYRNQLYIMAPLKPFDNTQVIPWLDITESLYIKGLDLSLSPELLEPFNIDNAKVSICFRQGGEKIQIPARAGTHDLKKLFQENGIPPWLRERQPLLSFNEHLFLFCRSALVASAKRVM